MKKCISDWKKAALTIKTASGIKKFHNEKGYGGWFNQLFALVKTRDSCQPEKAIEPSPSSIESPSKESQDANVVPVPPKIRKKSKNVPGQEVSKMVDILKEMVEKDQMKDLMALRREELQANREHEMRLYELMFNTMHGPILTQPHYQQNHHMQKNMAYHSPEPNFNNSFLNVMNNIINVISPGSRIVSNKPPCLETSTPSSSPKPIQLSGSNLTYKKL